MDNFKPDNFQLNAQRYARNVQQRMKKIQELRLFKGEKALSSSTCFDLAFRELRAEFQELFANTPDWKKGIWRQLKTIESAETKPKVQKEKRDAEISTGTRGKEYALPTADRDLSLEPDERLSGTIHNETEIPEKKKAVREEQLDLFKPPMR